MKVCVVHRTVYSTELSAGAGVNLTVNTEPNFGTPKACIIFYAEANANVNAYDTTTPIMNYGIGFAGPPGDGTTTIGEFTTFVNLQDNVTTKAGRREQSSSRVIRSRNTAGTVDYYQCTAVTFAADSATISFAAGTAQTNINMECVFVFFTGDDITVGVGSLAMNTANGGTASVSTFNFAPDCVIASFASAAANAGAATDSARLTFGAAVRTSNTQRCVSMRADVGGTSTVNNQFYTYYDDSQITGHMTSSAAWGDYTLSAWGANGFTITSNNANASNALNYLAIKGQSGNDFQLVELLSATATGNQFNSFGTTASRIQAVIGGIVGATTNNAIASTTPNCESFNIFASQASAQINLTGTGTATSSTGTTAITGSGTNFRLLRQGDLFQTIDNSAIGTISTVTSATALSLTANASTAITNASFTVKRPRQFCLTIGMQDNVTSTANPFLRLSSTAIVVAKTTGVDHVIGEITDFDTRPGFNINYTTASSSVCRGWVLGFADTSRRRRGSDVS
jgi:hypothetical protein